jgi:hypothetical protein
MSHATTDENRRAPAAMSCTAGAFLPVPLGPGSPNFRAAFGVMGATPQVSQLAYQCLVHQVSVNICFENTGRQVDGANCSAGHVEN